MTRTISTVKNVLSQRGTIGFLLIFLGLTLLAGVFLFSSFDNSDFEPEANDVSEPKSDDADQAKPQHVNVEIKSKISLKKQFFVAVRVEREESVHIINQIRTWVPEFQASENSGGLEFVSEIPLSTDPYKSQIIQTLNIANADKSTYCFLKSLDYFTKNSRSFWYMSIPANAYLNVAAIKSFSEILGSHDPMKNEIFYKNCDNNSCVLLLSRAAVNTLISNNGEISEINEIISSKSKPFEKGIFANGLSNEAASIIDSGDFSKIKKCKGNEDNKMKLKDSFIFFVDPKKMEKMKAIKGANNDIMVGVSNGKTVFCSI